jgi:hypothetical protein
VELALRLSTSSEGVSATAATCSGIRFTTVQGQLRITNRAGKFFCSKSVLISDSFIVLHAKLLKKIFWKNFTSRS